MEGLRRCEEENYSRLVDLQTVAYRIIQIERA